MTEYMHVDKDKFYDLVTQTITAILKYYRSRFNEFVTDSAELRKITYRPWVFFGDTVTKEITDERFFEIISTGEVNKTSEEQFVISKHRTMAYRGNDGVSLSTFLAASKALREDERTDLVRADALKTRCELSDDKVEVLDSDIEFVTTALRRAKD